MIIIITYETKTSLEKNIKKKFLSLSMLRDSATSEVEEVMGVTLLHIKTS